MPCFFKTKGFKLSWNVGWISSVLRAFNQRSGNSTENSGFITKKRHETAVLKNSGANFSCYQRKILALFLLLYQWNTGKILILAWLENAVIIIAESGYFSYSKVKMAKGKNCFRKMSKRTNCKVSSENVFLVFPRSIHWKSKKAATRNKHHDHRTFHHAVFCDQHWETRTLFVTDAALCWPKTRISIPNSVVLWPFCNFCRIFGFYLPGKIFTDFTSFRKNKNHDFSRR